MEFTLRARALARTRDLVASARGNPVGTPQDMINSPLEQFNILSVYDASLANSSVFEIMYAKILLTAWYTFYNLPETIVYEIGTNNELYSFSMLLGGSQGGVLPQVIPALVASIVFASYSVGALAQFIQSFI